MSDSQSTSNDFSCPECGATVSVSSEEMRAKAWCEACERDVLTPWSVTAPSTEMSDDDGYELAEGFEQPEAKVYIPIICRVCDTRMYATEDQVGQDIPCPDCFAENRVPPPSDEDRKKSVAENLGPDLEMGTGIVRPTMEQMGFSQLFEEEVSETEEHASSAAEKRPLAKVEVEEPRLTKWFLISRVFTFPFYPSVIVWWLGLSVGGTLILSMIQGVEKIGSGSPLAAVSIVFTVFAALGTGFIGAMLFSCCINVLQVSADGIDTLYSSEGSHILDRCFEAAYVVVSLVYSLLPGWGIGLLLRLAGQPDAFAAPISAFILFPICLLSSLESGSAVTPYSKPILRTIRQCWWIWLLFYLEAAVVVVLPHLLAEIFTGRIFDDPFIGPVVLVTQAIIYSRLLGRVAWYGSVRTAELDEQQELAEEIESDTPTGEQPAESDEPVASDQSE